MIKFFEKLLNLIYIQPCYFCKSSKEDTLLCSKCHDKIHFLPLRELRNENGVKIYSACLYDGIIKTLIRDFKYHNKKNLASIMAQLMSEYWQKLNIKDDFLLIPVPIHKSRLKQRKYNHMDIAVKEFSLLTNYKYNTDFLIRIKDTQNQYKLNRKERIENLRNAFDIDETKMPDLETPILITDDITSTGATLNEIIKLLKSKGYKNITAFTLSTPSFG